MANEYTRPLSSSKREQVRRMPLEQRGEDKEQRAEYAELTANLQ